MSGNISNRAKEVFTKHIRKPCIRHNIMIKEKEKLSKEIQLLNHYGIETPKALKKLSEVSSHIIQCEKCNGSCNSSTITKEKNRGDIF
jgi:hypothetical protein